jgi:hypothetical protein
MLPRPRQSLRMGLHGQVCEVVVRGLENAMSLRLLIDAVPLQSRREI